MVLTAYREGDNIVGGLNVWQPRESDQEARMNTFQKIIVLCVVEFVVLLGCVAMAIGGGFGRAAGTNGAAMYAWLMAIVIVSLALFLLGAYRIAVAERNTKLVLLRAVRYGDMVKVHSLLERFPVLVNAMDREGWTPLHWAAERGSVEMAELFISKGADVNVQDNENVTPLHVAAFYGRKRVAALLIANGAYIHMKDKHGKTPLDIAGEKGKNAVAELLGAEEKS
jgi:hypothetical protein